MDWRRFRAVGFVVAVIMIALMIIAVPPGSAAPPDVVGLAVTPQQTPWGSQTTLVMSGTGYTAGEPITITGGPFSDFQVNADSSGAFSTTRQVDYTWRYGIYTITAQGTTSGTVFSFETYLTRFDFYNNSDSNNPAVVAGSSANLTLQAWGFYRGEAITLNSDPPGLFAPVDTGTDGGGFFNVSNLNTNAAAAPGAYNIVATGATSGFSISRPFNVIDVQMSTQQLLAGQHPVLIVSASGLTSGADVSVSGGPFGSSVTRADGSGQISIQEPVVSTSGGRYHVSVTDNASGGRVWVPLYLTANWFYWNPVWRDSDQYFFAGGFQPNEVVRVTVSPAGYFPDFDVTADGEGNYSWYHQYNAGVPAGRYTFTASGLTSGYTSTNVLGVSGNGLGVTPQQAAVSGGAQQFMLSGMGFTPGEYVDITYSNGYWGAPFSNVTLQADGNGLITTTLQSTAGGGRQDVHAHGRSSGIDNGASIYLTGIDLGWGSYTAANTTRSQYFQGYGFQAGETVELTSNPPGLFPTGTVGVNSGGVFGYSLDIAAVSAGDYQIIATGQTSGYVGTGLYHVGSFALSPGNMVAGVVSDVTFNGAGYTPNEPIDVWNDYQGDLFAAFTVTADANGAFNATRTLSGSGCCGYWTWAHARGKWSGIQHDQQIHKLSLSADLYRAATGSTPTVSYYVRGFAQSGSVHLSSSPSGLFTEQDVALDWSGNANAGVTLNGAATAGTYTILAQDAGSGFTASATFVVEPAAAGLPVLHLDTTSRLFNANEGATEVQSANVGLNNQGGEAPLNWQAAASTASGGSWLSLDRTTGSTCQNCNDSFNIRVDPTGLVAGIYTGTVTVSGQGGAATGMPSGLLDYWPGDGNANDAAGGHAGTPQGGTTFTAGKVGQSFTFDGASGYVDLGPWFDLQTFSFSMWINPGSSQVSWADIIDNNHTDYRSWVTQYQNTGSVFNFGGAGSGVSFTLTPGDWQQLVLTRDANHVNRVYLNGALVGTGAVGSELNYDGTQFLRLSRWGGGGRYFNGQIDEVRLYDHALSVAEVEGLCNSENGGTCSGLLNPVNSPQSFLVTLGIQGGTALTLTPNQVAAGTYPTVTLSATGFGPNEVVDITGGPWTSIVDKTDAAGNLSHDVQVGTYNAGQYNVTIHGRSSGLQTSGLFSVTGITANPTGARSGQSTALRVSGSGYVSGETITLSSSPDGLFPSATVTADANGAFNFAGTIPTGTSAGQYQIVATGASTYSAQTIFNLSTLSVTPGQTTQHGVQLLVSAAGYKPNEQVHFWLTLPYCCGTPVDTTLVADGSGVVTGTLTLPPTMSNSMYVAYARGNSSGVENTTSFYQTGLAFNKSLVSANTPTAAQLSGGGFHQGEVVNLASSPSGLFSALPVAADASGNFAVNLSINAPAGFYHVVATGATSGFNASTDLHVGNLSVTPSWQVAGSTTPLTIQSTGYAANDTVHVGRNNGTTAPFENFDRTVDASGVLSVTRSATNGSAQRFDVQVWDDRGALSSVPFYQVSSWLDTVNGTLGQANTFNVNGRGYVENETVQVTSNDARLFAPVTLFADGGGNFRFGITTKASAPAGGYVLSVRGVSSGFATTLNYHVGSFSVSPVQAAAGQHPALQMQGNGYASGERIHFYGGPWNEFWTPADVSGVISTTQGVYTNNAGRYVVTAAGDSGAVGRATFYLTGVWLSTGQVTAGYSGNLFVYGAGFGENEPVSLSVQPTGLFSSNLPATTDPNGNVGVVARVNPAAATGLYTITLTGVRTGYTASASFAIGSFSASPNHATRGIPATVTLTGSGYRPGGTVHFWQGPWGDVPATVDASGSFTQTLDVDPGSPAGRYTLRAYSYDDGTDKYTPFNLTGLSVFPSNGLVSVSNNLTIGGAGYKAGDLVTVSAGPAGLFTPRTVLVGPDGSWSLDLNTDPGASTGGYTIVAVGSDGYSASAPFAIGTATAAPFVGVAPDNLSLETTNTSPATSRLITLTNSSGAAVDWTASAQTNDGGSWLSVSPTSGSLDVGASQAVTVTMAPFRLTASTFGGTITINPAGGVGGNPASVAVQMKVSQGQAGLTVSPRQGLHGTTPTLTLQGAGYVPNEQVSVMWGPFDDFVVNADVAGTFTATRQILPLWDSNGWSVRAYGNSSGLDYRAPFNLTWLQLQTAGVTAGSGDPLVFNVRGWEPGEPVTVTVTPAGLVADTVGITDGGGNIWNWSLPTKASAPAGIYTVQVTGQTSGMQMSVPFHMVSLSATPSTIQAGQHPMVTLTGYGFTPGNDVGIANGPFGYFVVKASDSGSLNVEEQVYSNSAGSFSLRATDIASGASTYAPLNLVGISLYWGNNGAGGENYLFGGGFLPGEVLSVHVTPAGGINDFTVNTDGGGNFNWYHFWTIGGAANDQYTLTATGSQSGRVAQTVLNINGANGFSISPSAAVAGSIPLLTLTAHGFSAGELVDFNDGPYTNFILRADSDGAVTTTVQVTTGEARRWSPYARGRSSGIVAYASYAQPGAWSDSWQGLTVGYTGGVVLRAGGFLPGESLTFQSSPAGLFAPISAVVDGNGNTSSTVQVNNAPAGAYTITAIGQNSGYSASFLFPVAALRVSPSEYRAGETPLLTITEEGFRPGETVRLYDDSCWNCLFDSGFATVADANGVYTTSFRPTSSSSGIHTLRARGDSSQNNTYASIFVSQLSGPGQLNAGQAATPTFSVRGFRQRAAITLSSSPAGLFNTATSATDDGGALDFPVALNTAAPAGKYRVIVTDVATGFSAGIDLLLTTAGTPVLSMDTSPRAFVATVGDTAVQGQGYYLNNSGGGVLNWTTSASTVSGGNWLSADASGSYPGGSCCYYPAVRIDPTGLLVGVYTGTLTVSAAGADNAPQSMQVRLNIQPVGGGATAAVAPAYGPINVAQRLAITGAGFNSGEPVEVTSSVFDRSATVADASGQVSLERFVSYSESWRAGRQWITLRGLSSGISATTYYGLQRFDVSPLSAMVGQSAVLTADVWGMAPGEGITFSAQPDGLLLPSTLTADGNGYVHATFNTNATALIGNYVIHAVGATSGSDLQRQFSLSQLSVNPLQWHYDPGQNPQLFIEGNGYAPNEWVDISTRRYNNLDCCGWWYGGISADFTVRSDASGHFGVSVQVDPSTWSGDYDLRAYGRDSHADFHTRIYQTDFDYRDAGGNTHVSLVPAGVTTTIVLRGWGFQPNESIILTGDTGILDGQTTAVASSAGDWQISVPISATAGTYSIMASGQASGFTTLSHQLYVGGASVAPNHWLRWQSPTLNINALGFRPEEQVTISQGPFDDFSVLADVTGAISITRRVTYTDRQQQWSLRLHGAQSGIDQYVRLYQTGMWLSLGSATATVPTNVWGSGYGFWSTEAISVTSTPPGLFDPTSFFVDGGGSGSFCWWGCGGSVTTRADASPGQYQIVLTGQSSGYQISQGFQVVAPGAPFMTLNTNYLGFGAVQDAGAPADQTLVIGNSSEGTTLSWTANVTNTVGGNWLSISSNSGTTAWNSSSSFTVHADPTGLTAGTYTGQIVVDGGAGTTNGHQVVNVRFDVASPAAQLTLSTHSLSYNTFTGTNPTPQGFRVSNTGGTPMTWTAASGTPGGGDWLAVSPSGGTLPPNSFFDVFVEITATNLTAGTYIGRIDVAGDAATHDSPQSIDVALHVEDRPTQADMTVSPHLFSFSGTEGVPSNPSSSLTISNTGGTDLYWGSSVATSNNTPWLTLSPSSSTTARNGGTQVVGVNVNTTGLFAGVYTATITLSDANALHSPQVVTATLTMATPPPPGLQVTPGYTLTFLATQGGANPLDQQLQVTNSGVQTLIWGSAITTTDGGNWLTISPTHGSATGGNSNTTNVHVSVAGLMTGNYTGTITISGTVGTTNSPREVPVSLRVNPAPPVPLSVQVGTDKYAYGPNDTMVVTATVKQGSTPITNASVQARYVAPDGTQQLVALGQVGASNVYTGPITLGSAVGSGMVYVTAGTPDGLTATGATKVLVTGHNLTFAGNQTFPQSMRQSDNGLVNVNVWNDAYVEEPTRLELTDVTGSTPMLLAFVEPSAAPRTLNNYSLGFSGANLALGTHTLQVTITKLPAGEAADAVTQISGQVLIVAPQPQMSVNPLAPTLSVQAGGSTSQSITVSNYGAGSSLTGIQMSLVSRSGGTPYSWISLNATSLGALGYNGSSSFTVHINPPSSTVPGAYQDTAVQIETDNGGSLQVPLTVYVDTNRHTSVLFAVSDNTGQAVTNGQVRLTSTVAPYPSQTGQVDAHGVVTFTNVSLGIPYTYDATAPNHDNATGYYTAQDETVQTVPVVLQVQAVQTTWTVVPTTIEDVYDINLQITYEVDVPVPQLAVDPAWFAYTKDPANPAGPMLLNSSSVTSGDMTIYNPSRITVNNVVVDASGVLGVNVTLAYNGAIGNVITIPTIPPLSNVKVRYETSAYCPVGQLDSQIAVRAEYSYFKITPTLSLSEDNWTMSVAAGAGATKNLILSNTGYNVATGVTVSTPTHPWISVPHLLGDLGIGITAAFPIVVSPPPGTPAGTYTEDLLITAGNSTPENHLVLTVVINGDGSFTFEGAYTAGSVPASTGNIQTNVPVTVYSCADPVPGGTGGSGGAPVLSFSSGGGIVFTYPSGGVPPNVSPPPPPTPTAHEIVKLEIPQKATLERQAFIATLQTTDTAGASLENFQVLIKVTDPAGSETNGAGQRYVDLFAITPPTESGYGANHSIADGQTATSEWTLIPSAGLGGSNPDGMRYEVSAIYSYDLAGVPQSVSTGAVEITIYPMPQLMIDYYVPRDIKANHPVKLGVVVRNVGDGTAKNLTIVSGQPVITENQSGILITFALLGASLQGASVPASSLTLSFGDVPAHGQSWGYWVLGTDLDGQVTAFTATYTERDYKGATLSPLIVGVHTNIIVQGDVVPSGGQSMLQVVAPAPDVDPNTLIDLNTAIETPLTTVYVADATLATMASPQTTFCQPSTVGWLLAVVPDPLPSVALSSVRASYSNGTSQELYNGSGLVWRGSDPQGNKVYVVDTLNGSSACYTISYNAPRPDLIPIEIVPLSLSSVTPGQTIPITYTVKNQGTGAAVAPWHDQVYLAQELNGTSGMTAVAISDSVHNTGLAAGESYTVTTNVTIPTTTTAGLHYLVVNTDDIGQMTESDETNNARSVSITVQVTTPDLAPTALAAAGSGLPGQSLPVTLTVQNQGAASAAPSWLDRAVWSTSESLADVFAVADSSTHVSPLGVGASYSVTFNVSLPTITGTYYLIAQTDAGSSVGESDETNNWRVTRITVGQPDLTPTAFTTPPAGKPGQTVPLTWTIKNQGLSDVLPIWQDRVYLSTDTVRDSADTLVTVITRTLSLTPGSSYSISQNVSVPWVTPGSYYLLLRTDMWGQVAESDETNNERVVPLVVGTPDLTPTAFTAPSSAVGWQTVPLTWTVKNQSHRDAAPSWQDRVYLSTDSVWDGGDTLVTSVTHGVTVTAGSSYTETQSVVVPLVSSGSYRLLLLTDIWNQVDETDETNNVQVVSINIGPPELTPTSFQTPVKAEVGQVVPLTWTVKNGGLSDAPPTWHDRVYLSTDNTYDSGDVLVTNVARTLSLTAGSSYTVTQSVTVPWVTGGNYYLILRTDMWNNVAESDETNNTRVVPIVVGIPDLTPTGFTAPSSAVGWQTVTPTWTIKNQGHGDAPPSWQDRIYLSTDNTYDSGDTFLTTVTHGVTATAGSSYSVSQSMVVPKVVSGTYYLLLLTDMWNAVSETDETNNVRVQPINIGPPDLTPTEFLAPGVVKPGQAIPITWTVKNQGLSDVLPTWYDRVYLSTDNTYDSGDILLVNVTRTFTLLPGTSYTTTRGVVVPRMTPGSYHLILRADMWGQVTEADETNNERVMPLVIGLPDLTPTSFNTPATGKPWQTVPVTWTVKNQGAIDAPPSWEDRIYASTDGTWDSGDIFLTKVTRATIVPAGGSYTLSANVALPGTGTYYLILRTDMWGQVAEADETNNERVVPLTVGLPDLTPTAFAVPVTGTPWQVVSATWTVKNQGPLGALPSWEDRVYLSANSTWDSGDIVLTKVTHSAPVAAGDSYAVSANVTLPGTGTHYLILRTDVWSQVAEGNETNNSTAVAVVVNP